MKKTRRSSSAKHSAERGYRTPAVGQLTGKLKLRAWSDQPPGEARKPPTRVSSHFTAEEREALINRARDGKPVSIEVEAITFIQGEEPNRNLTRFSEDILGTLAASFTGRPVLRDHATDDSLARAGTITSSKLEARPGEPGAWQMRMVLELTAPWAVELALRDLGDAFSIGWHSTGTTVCSICGELYTQVWEFLISRCEHALGLEYDGKICQLEFTDAEGVEVSMVTVPAVRGTGVDRVEARLCASSKPAAAAHLSTGGPPPRLPARTPPTIPPEALVQLRATLSLPATADAPAIVAAAVAQGAQLKAAQEALARHEAATLETAIDAEIERGIREGRLRIKRDEAGQRIEGAIEKSIRRLGRANGIEAAREYVNDLAIGALGPVLGAAPRSLTADPSPQGEPLSPEQRRINRLIGVDDVAVAKHIAAERRAPKED